MIVRRAALALAALLATLPAALQAQERFHDPLLPPGARVRVQLQLPDPAIWNLWFHGIFELSGGCPVIALADAPSEEGDRAAGPRAAGEPPRRVPLQRVGALEISSRYDARSVPGEPSRRWEPGADTVGEVWIPLDVASLVEGVPRACF